MEEDKEIRADAKLLNLPKEELDTLWRFRNPEKGGTKMTLEAIAVEIPLRYGFTVSLSSLSRFYKRLRQKRRWEDRRMFADQLKEELAKDPDMTEELIERAGRKLFMTEGVVEKDVKAFAAMVKIGQGQKKLEQGDRKLEQDEKRIELKKKDQTLDERRVAVLERKAAAFDAAKGVSDNDKLTPEEKAKRLKSIFGMG